MLLGLQEDMLIRIAVIKYEKILVFILDY